VRLILVRHGQSTWNAERRIQGVADPSLSAAGRRQCARLRPLLEALSPDVLVTSDLARARETAALLAPGAAAPDPRWREVDLGAWTGRPIDEMEPAAREALERWRQGEADPPDGETWEAVRGRLRAAVDELAQAGARRPLVVTHGGAIRAACAILGGPDLRHLVGVPNASLTVLDTAPRPHLRAYGVAPPAGARRT
jgi:broad specificity phosphatase PhoE